MSESKLFISISKIAKKLVLTKWLQVESEDLVQQAYLSVLEQGKELNLKNLLTAVDKEVNELKNRNSANNEKYINETQFSFCRKCKESKPIAAFGITIRSTGKKVIQSYCSECQAEAMRQIYRKQGRKERTFEYIDFPPEITTTKQKKAYRHKLWREKNKEKWANYQKINQVKFKDKIAQRKKEWYLKKKTTPSISKAAK